MTNLPFFANIPIVTNKTKTSKDKLVQASQQAGLALMTAAVTLGMLELPDHPNSKVVVPNQPAFAFTYDKEGTDNNPIRREREDTEPHYISYSVSQRTPSRHGRI